MQMKERAPEVCGWSDEHAKSLQKIEVTRVVPRLARVLARGRIAQVAHAARHRAQQISPFRAGDQLLCQHRTETDAVVVDLPPQARHAGGMLVPDDGTGFVYDGMSGSQHADEEVEIFGTTGGSTRAQNRVEASQLAADPR